MRCYLNFFEHATQIWIDKYVLYLALVIAKLYIFKLSLDNGITNCQEQTQLFCESFQSISNQANQFPELVAQVIDYLIDEFMTTLLSQLHMMLNVAVHILKAVIGFVIELYLGTITCLLTALIKGSLEVLTDATRTITEAVESAVNEFLSLFNTALDGLGTVVNGFVTALNAIKSLFTGTDTNDILSSINTVNLTASTIKNISIPTSFIDDLSSLSSKIPDYESVLSNLTSVVTEPLDYLLTEIEDHFSRNTTLELPSYVSTASSASGEACLEVSKEFDKVKSALNSLCLWLILGLGLAIIALIGVLLILASRTSHRRAGYVNELIMESDPDKIGNVLEVQGNHLARFFMNGKVNDRLKWLANYSLSTPALNCLSIGIIGLAVVGVQYWIILLTSRKLSDISSGVGETIQDASSQTSFNVFLSRTQNAIDQESVALNEELFGNINATSSSLYDTLVEAENSVNDSISSVFGGTLFGSALSAVVYCTVGRKIEKIEDGLEWLSSNLRIEFPVLPEEDMSRLVSQSISNSTNEGSGLPVLMERTSDAVVESFKKSLRVELIVSSVLVGIWVFVFLLGVLILAIRNFVDEKVLPTVISMPKPLAKEAIIEYAYPINDPFVRVSSSLYTDSCVRSSIRPNK